MSLARCIVAAAVCLPGPLAVASSLSLDRGPLVLGETGPVGVTIRAPEGPGEEDRPLRLSVNVGSFGEISRVGPGVYRTIYSPPPTRFPQVALVAVWRETGPDAPIDFLSVPLYGATRVPVRVQAGAEVRATVGPEQFGPFVAGAGGRLSLPLKVPPGVHEATLSVRERGGAVRQRALPIQVPPYDRLTAALVPHAVVADGASRVRLVVYYEGEAGTLSPRDIHVRASRGEAVLERAESKRFVYGYVPPAGCTDRSIDFTVSVGSDRAAVARASVTLGLPPPARLVLRPPAQPVIADGHSTAAVRVLALDEGGLGLPLEGLEVTANGVRLPPLRYVGDGVHETMFTAPADYPPGGLVELVATAPGPPSLQATARYQLLPGRRPRTVVASVSPSPVPADSSTSATVRFVVRDEAGQPLAGAHLVAIARDGTVGKLEDEGGGSYVASYTPPASLPAQGEELRIEGTAEGFEESLPLPLRAKPGHLLLGVRAAFSYSFADLYGPRVGLDAFVPIRLGSQYFGVGVSALFGMAGLSVSDPVSGLTARSQADFVPLALRLGYELYAGRRLSLWAGLGGVATWAQFSTAPAGAPAETQNQWGFGGQVFFGLAYALGPGQFFADLSYSYEPVQSSSTFATFNLDAGGLALEAGYRFALL
ncbi:MAG TPA: hypothetical protein VMB50_22705 [Myxococcales bacterium]|nr:hypothetical protein [Myxococcales bacterium]